MIWLSPQGMKMYFHDKNIIYNLFPSWGDSLIKLIKKGVIMSVEDKIKKVIAEKLSVDINDVVPKASFVDDLGADSLDLVELIMSMEEEFDIDIDDKDAEKIKTVQDVFDYVKEHL